MVTYPSDTVFVCASLAFPVMLNRLSSGGYQPSFSSRQRMLMCHYKILFAGMHFGTTAGQNEWQLMLLAALEWAHREGWLILSFYTIHLQSTWLSAFFSQREISGFPAGSPRSQCVMTTKHFQGRLGVREDATKRSLRPCHCPQHAARNRLMTDTFEKASNCGLSTSNSEQNGGSVAHKIISQQLKCSLYFYATYPQKLKSSTEYFPNDSKGRQN